MSHQERTWVAATDKETGLPRWDVYINGRSVPGGYVVKRDEGVFECHYPHVAPFCKDTLEKAKERLEWAPPVTEGVMHIGRQATEEQAGSGAFVSRDEAARRLGVSQYRVNAMVANGKLVATRTQDGGYEVLASSLDDLAKLACENG